MNEPSTSNRHSALSPEMVRVFHDEGSLGMNFRSFGN
jgi:hypothetical protein